MKRSDWRWIGVESSGNTVRLTVRDMCDGRRTARLTMGVLETKQLAEVLMKHANSLIKGAT